MNCCCTVQTVAETMNVKAASIRLVDKERDELVIKAVYNLSKEYLSKGPIRLSTSYITDGGGALLAWGSEFVRDLKNDPLHAQYPLDAARGGDCLDFFCCRSACDTRGKRWA